MTPRIPFAPPAASEEARELEARILKARGQISPLYRILLNSPPVCDGWEHFLTAIRQKTSISPALRELIILRVAVVNNAPYEFEAHIPHAKAAGISDAKMAALRTSERAAFDETELLVIDYTDAVTRDIVVPDALFARIAARFDTQGQLDVTATIAAYNMVSRLLTALNVH